MNVRDLVRVDGVMLGMVREVTRKKILVEDADDHTLWWPRDRVVLAVSLADSDPVYDGLLGELRGSQDLARGAMLRRLSR